MNTTSLFSELLPTPMPIARLVADVDPTLGRMPKPLPTPPPEPTPMVRSNPWTRVGRGFEPTSDADEALHRSGLNWAVEKVGLRTEDLAPVPGQFAIRRSDTGKVLGLVGAEYNSLQNDAAFGFFRSLAGCGPISFESAGCFDHGAIVWVQARLPDLQIRFGDDISETMLFTRAVEKGLLSKHPLEGLKLPRVPPRQAVFLSRDERERLLNVAFEYDQDFHLVIALGVYLGLRKAEMLALCWEHLDFGQRVAQVLNTEDFETKSLKNRSVPMCGDIVDLLTPHRRATGFVLKPNKGLGINKGARWSFYDGFRTAVRLADLDPTEFTPHSLRHTFASICVQANVGLYKISKWMGHSMSEVTAMYAHLNAFDDDIEKLSRTNDPTPNTVRVQ